MATDTFLMIGGIEGESTDDRHKGEIEVLSWSWGVTQTSSPAAGGGVAAGRASFSDFSFTHHLDRASPSLMKACATGEHIPEATVTVRKAGEGQQDFLIIKMSEVMVTSVQPSGSGEADGLYEMVGLQLARVDLEYKAQKPDGSLAAGVHFTFDIKAHKLA